VQPMRRFVVDVEKDLSSMQMGLTLAVNNVSTTGVKPGRNVVSYLNMSVIYSFSMFRKRLVLSGHQSASWSDP